MYPLGPRFKQCIKAFVEYGLKLEDDVLLSVLLDDDKSLDTQLANKSVALAKSYSFDVTFTPFYEVSLLHICPNTFIVDSGMADPKIFLLQIQGLQCSNRFI